MKQKEILLVTGLVLLILGFIFWGAKFYGSDEAQGVNYFTGTLVFGRVSRCGLVKTLKMDRSSCSISNDFCVHHDKLLNRRVRVSAISVPCTERSIMKCAEGMDFYEEKFTPTQCFSAPTLIKAFDD